ncbi:MAG: DUF3592 domain-containing protein, partial [Planctomycetota bacterium]|nr:DUF3592 domain-containing protein [Planctomycetota bacterium]
SSRVWFYDMSRKVDQILPLLDGLRKFRWFFRAIAGVGIALVSYCFVVSLNEFMKASSSRDWPMVQGRVVYSRVDSYQEGDGLERMTVYRAIINYSYRVGETTFQGKRISFSGWGGPIGTTRTADESVARSEADRYPVRAVVKVFYNPRDPGEAVLEPGATNQNRKSLILSIVFLIGAALFFWVLRRLILNAIRSAIAQKAGPSNAEAWELAGKYGLAPPKS